MGQSASRRYDLAPATESGRSRSSDPSEIGTITLPHPEVGGSADGFLEPPPHLSGSELRSFILRMGHLKFHQYCLTLDLRGREEDPVWRYGVELQELGTDASQPEIQRITHELLSQLPSWTPGFR